MTRRWLVHCLALIPLAVVPTIAAPLPQSATMQPSSPQDDPAVQAALQFVTRYEEGDLGDVYDQELSTTFKSLMGRDMFVQQGGFMRMQSGGRAKSREFIGIQPFKQTPTGQTGDYRYIRFRTLHPNGLVFQDVYVENVSGIWKVMGFYVTQAPQQ